ncbi:hypothetical protein GF337_15685, partial [candidate division KSB1 bacterium]|nr:hypothetical protein [candidate division KSB1 bacterium]
VDDNAIIWLNEKKVGEHYGANSEFKLNLTPHILKGENRLAILVEDTGGPGGLNGSVTIIPFQEKEDLLKGRYFDAPTPEHPEWAQGAVIYELNTRQFTLQGTFKAIEPRIPELNELGVDIIWFMPIHPIGEKRRKGTLGSYYSIKDFYGINLEFGTLSDFRDLVQQIHEAGMYVIIDLVANHTAWDNPMIEEHPDWYTHDSEGDIVSPNPDWHDVADLNYENKELWKYMIKMMGYWVREINIDGYRCDVASMVPTPFWIEARKHLDSIKPVFMLAEAETPELNAYGFDMTYASAMHKLFNDIASAKRSPKRIDEYLRHEYYHYPQGSMRMRFTSNHDENTWNKSAIIRMGRGGAKVGAVLTFTLPGTPLIYNGQETGNEKSLEFFERDPIVWKESEFRPFYQKLTSVYHHQPSLVHGTMTKLISTDDDRIYAFVRQYEDDQVIVIANFSEKPFSGDIDFSRIEGLFTDIFSGKKLSINDTTMQMQLSAWEYLICVE